VSVFPAFPVLGLVIGKVSETAFTQANADGGGFPNEKHRDSGYNDRYADNHHETDFEFDFHFFPLFSNVY